MHEGLILSAFGWTYAAMQIPGGWLVDRVAPRVLYAAALILWSAATFFMGFASSFIVLFVLRLAVGALEAPAYPINNRVVTTWFPEKERATAIGFYTSGQFVGLAFLTPVLAWLQHHYGWHMVFVSTGLLGIIWGVVWFMVYREPRQFKGANAAEIELIQKGGGVVDLEKRVTEEDAPTARPQDGLPAPKGRLSPWSGPAAKESAFQLERPRSGHVPTQAVGRVPGPVLPDLDALVLPDLVPDLSGEVPRHGLHQVGLPGLGALPGRLHRRAVLGRAVGLSDPPRRHGGPGAQAAHHPGPADLHVHDRRQLTDSTPWVIFFLAVAFFGNGLASITWSLVSALAPVRLLGLTGGVFNFVGNLSSICTPIVIGLLVSRTASRPPSCTCPRWPCWARCRTSCWWARWSGSKPDPPPPRLSQARGLPGHDAGGAMVLRKQSPHPSMRFPSLPDLIDRQETPQRSTGEYAPQQA